MAIQDNVSIIQTSQGSGSGGVCNLNIFTQLEEPEKKEGIWIKTSDQYKNIVVDDHMFADGTWSEAIEDLPYEIVNSVVVYHGDIHIIGSHNSRTYRNHYKFDGSVFTKLNNLPIDMTENGNAFVFNDHIYIYLGSGFYIWDDQRDTWSIAGTLPKKMSYGFCFKYNNKIYIGGDNYHYTNPDDNGVKKNVYSYDGSSFTYLGKLVPYVARATCTVHNGIAYIYADVFDGSSVNGYYLIYFDGTKFNWTKLGTSYNEAVYSQLISYNGRLYLYKKDKYYIVNEDNVTFTMVGTIPIYMNHTKSVLYNGEVHLIGSTEGSYTKKRSYFSAPQLLYQPHSVIIQRGNSQNGVYLACISDTSIITGDKTRFLSGFDDVYYMGESEYDLASEMYYGNGTEWVKFKN